MLAVQSIHTFSTLAATEPAANEDAKLDILAPHLAGDEVPPAAEPATSHAGNTAAAHEGLSATEYYPHLQPANDHRFTVALQLPAAILPMRPTPVAATGQSPTAAIVEALAHGVPSLNSIDEIPGATEPVVPPIAVLLTQAATAPAIADPETQPSAAVAPAGGAIPSVALLVAKKTDPISEGFASTTVVGVPVPDQTTATPMAESLEQATDASADVQSPALDKPVVAPIARPRRNQVWARNAADFMRPAFRYMRPGVLYLLVVPTVVAVNLGYETVRDTWRDYATAKASVASLRKQVAELQRPAPSVPQQPSQPLPAQVINGPGAMPPYAQYMPPAPVSMPLPLPDESPARAAPAASSARAKQSHSNVAAPSAAKSDIPEDGEFVLEKAGTKQAPTSEFKLVGDK